MNIQYVVRDFSTVLGVDGPTFAIVHVVDSGFGFHCCEVLERYSARDEAYVRGTDIALMGSDYVYRETSVAAAEAVHRQRFEVEFSIKRHECIDRHQKWRGEQITTAPVADDTDVIYHGSLTEFHGQRLRAARCYCRDDDCRDSEPQRYELEDPATDIILLRHVRRSSITPVEDGCRPDITSS